MIEPPAASLLFAFMNKSKYWDLYRDLYPIMTEKGGGRFPQMFGEEFVRAYERQVAEYQRHDREGASQKVDAETMQPRTIPPCRNTEARSIVIAESAAGADPRSKTTTIVESVSGETGCDDRLAIDDSKTLAEDSPATGLKAGE